MDLLYVRESATVRQICEGLADPPTPMAVRRMLAILLQKGHVRRSQIGRQFLYAPKTSQARAGLKAFRHVLATFFGGSLGGALATYLQAPGAALTDEEVARLAKLIADRAPK